jgi:hypothetical protein
MITMTVLAILLTVNMLLLHFDKIVQLYYFLYKKLIPPRFKVDELVMIDNIEYRVLHVAKSYTPYTYFCLPSNGYHGRMPEAYFHESRIKKKTGLLKELE